MSWSNTNLQFKIGDVDRFGYTLLDRVNAAPHQCVDLWQSSDKILYKVSVPKNDKTPLAVRFDNRTFPKSHSYELYRSFVDLEAARKIFDALSQFTQRGENEFIKEAALLLRGVEPKYWIMHAENTAMPMISLKKWYNESLSLIGGDKNERGNRLQRRDNIAKGECLDQWEMPDRRHIVCISENDDEVRVVPTAQGDKPLSKTFIMAAEATRFFNNVKDDMLLACNGSLRGDPEKLYDIFLQRAEK